MVAVADEAAARDLRLALKDTDIRVFSGPSGVEEAARTCGASVAVMAVLGLAALAPTLAAIDAGMDIAIANKEALVCGGDLILGAAKERGVRVIPVDSEHSAIFQCLQDRASAPFLTKILLTASGGPFYGRDRAALEKVTAADALQHPNWRMGAKITVDSATMMNKGLERIEAMRLYGVSAREIQIVIHRESIVHSMVEFADGAVLAQLSTPDMRLPIQYALTYPDRSPGLTKRIDWTTLKTLHFDQPDEENFPCLPLSMTAAEGGCGDCVKLNGANEAAVALFLGGKIGFMDIPRRVERALGFGPRIASPSLAEIFALDKEARARAAE